MKTFRLFGIALMAILLSMTACSDGGGEDNPTTPSDPEKPKSEIKIDSGITANGVTFSEKAGEQTVSFSTNEKWTLSIAETRNGTSWVTPSATSDNAGDATITFKVTENTDYDDRSVAVTIKAGTASITFKITQKGVDALLVTTTTYNVPQEGGTIEIEVKANIDYQMEISETAKSWITEASSRALTTHKHSLKIAANEELEKREGEIHFKSGDKVETVHVYQTGGAIILLSQSELTVSDKGETISVEIKSNCEYGVQMPDVDWITEDNTRAASSHTLKYIIAANEEYDSRSAQIIYFDKNSDMADTLTITQAQKDAIIISKKEYAISNGENTIEVELNSNVEYEATAVGDATDWISKIENSTSRALVKSKLYFSIAANESYNSRVGKIAIHDKGQALTDTITITQKPQMNIILAQKEHTLSSDGGTIDVELQSNIDFSVKMPDADWITKIESRGLETHKFSYKIAANESYDKRTAQIIYYDKNSDAADTLTVIQAQKDAIILSKKEITVEAEGGTIEVKLNTNVDFEIQMPDVNWLSQSKSRALTEHTLTFIIDKNENEEAREAKIVFTNKENGISATFTVKQNGAIFGSVTKEGNLWIVAKSKAGNLSNLLGDNKLNIIKLYLEVPKQPKLFRNNHL